MKVKWSRLAVVALIAGAIIGYKAHMSPQAQAQVASTTALPRVVLLAELGEADSAGDACADVIRLVRAARDRGVAVQEFNADSKSGLLARYHLLVIPTVLILDGNGQEVSRFEGEGRTMVKAVRTALDQLR